MDDKLFAVAAVDGAVARSDKKPVTLCSRALEELTIKRYASNTSTVKKTTTERLASRSLSENLGTRSQSHTAVMDDDCFMSDSSQVNSTTASPQRVAVLRCANRRSSSASEVDEAKAMHRRHGSADNKYRSSDLNGAYNCAL